MVREVKSESEAANRWKSPVGRCMLRWGGLEEKCEQTQDNTSTPMAPRIGLQQLQMALGWGDLSGHRGDMDHPLNHPPHPPAD